MGVFNINPPLPPILASTTFAGQHILITGASAGIGLACARELLAHHVSTLYFGVRDLSKGELAHQELLSDSAIRKTNPHASIELFPLDLSSYSSVFAFAKEFSAKVDRLDAVILNAGTGTYRFTPLAGRPGNEITLQVNYLSNALLAVLLLPLLARASRSDRAAHLVFVGSIGAHKTSLEEQPFKSPKPNIVASLNTPGMYGGFERYSMSKLFVHMWARELAARASSSHVVINAVCPGFTNSSIDRGLPFYLRPLVSGVRKLISRSSREGAIAYMHALIAPEETSGAFYSDGVVLAPSRFESSSEGADMQKRVWEETVELLRAEDPEIVVTWQ